MAGPSEAIVAEKNDDNVTVVTSARSVKKPTTINEEEPLVDKTAALTLRSKRTERIQKKQIRKRERTTVSSDTKSFLELPPELLNHVLCYLRPSELIRLLRLSRSCRSYILENESDLAREVNRRRYRTLSRSFPLPVLLSEVDPIAQKALGSMAWQSRLQIHKKPYQHLRPVDHTESDLDERRPIPMIPRGTSPQWNRDLVDKNASQVQEAMRSPLRYSRILERHLDTTCATLTRQVRVGKKTVHPRQLFHLSAEDVRSGSDDFLERSGPPSNEFPFHRDNYYYLEAYVPNRRWSTDEQEWQYYAPGKAHENDVAWVAARFTPQKGLPGPVVDREMDTLFAEFKTQQEHSR